MVNKDMPFKNADGILPEKFSIKMAEALQSFIDKMKDYYTKKFEEANQIKEAMIAKELNKDEARYKYYKNTYHNESVSDAVKKVFEKNKILEYNHELVQQIDPIFKDPSIKGIWSLRSHFYAPRKPFLGKYYDTYWYNMIVVWVFTLLLYITLYFELLSKLLNLMGRIKFRGEIPD